VIGTLHLVDGGAVADLLDGDRGMVLSTVERAYRARAEGRAGSLLTPHLHPPRRPGTRFGALPAWLDDADAVRIGMKWIASVPENLAAGLPRASAVILLNDPETGMPVACLEGGSISAARTAASAAVAARRIRPARRAAKLAVIGTGRIARTTLAYLAQDGWDVAHTSLFDRDPARAHAAAQALGSADMTVAGSTAEALADADLVIFATTALEPYLDDPKLLRPGSLVLHLSLRDLAPAIILAARNYVDDRVHALTAMTSLHLTLLETGRDTFVTGDVGDLLDQSDCPEAGTTIFSPFGLGMLDVALAGSVFDRALGLGRTIRIERFFG
jgi:ornithine cyclodeaminase